jgi:regulator of sigma E protease
MPAEQAGLKTGDRVVSIDGQPVATWEELSGLVLASKGRTLNVVVERDGAQLPIQVTPALHGGRSMFGEEMESVYRIGIEASHDWSRVGPFAAIGMAAEQTYTASFVVLKGLLLMVQGRVPLSELGGPIAIARAAGQQAQAGASRFLSMLAFLSVNSAC